MRSDADARPGDGSGQSHGNDAPPGGGEDDDGGETKGRGCMSGWKRIVSRHADEPAALVPGAVETLLDFGTLTRSGAARGESGGVG